jgi:aldehyde dehydrogenase (NAD+)
MSTELVTHAASTTKVKKGWEYAPAPEQSDKVRLKARYQLFIGGKWCEPESGRYFSTVNPATEQAIAEVAEANEADVDRAVKSARHAYDSVWSKLRPADRAKYIYRIARRIQERARELAIVESLDGGKPIKESRDSMCPWRLRTSFTTPAGPTSSTTRSRGEGRVPSASQGR